MSELNDHLSQVEEIATRARDFQGNEASDPRAISTTVVEDVGALAEAVVEIIKQAES